MQSPDRQAAAQLNLIKVLHLPLAISAALVMVVPTLVTATGYIATDFSVFRTAWWLILNGQGGSLYDEGAQRAAQHLVMRGWQFEGGLMAFLNPPHVALAGVPLGWLAERAGGPAAFVIWMIVNLLLFVRLDRLIRDRFGATGAEARWMITVVLLGFYPVFYTIAMGQLSLVLAVASLELVRSLERRRARAAAAWLVALSIKPQLLPPILLFLAVRRYWDVLAWGALIGAAAALLCAAVLGPSIWLEYIRNVHGLERFFGSGTPVYMMNIRGALTRLTGVEGDAGTIYAVALAAWAAAMTALSVALFRRTASGRVDLRADFALTLAVALLFNPHLFPQDTVLWIPVLGLYTTVLMERSVEWKRFAGFALSWPAVFAATRVVDHTGSQVPPLAVDPAVTCMIATVVVIGRGIVGTHPRTDLAFTSDGPSPLQAARGSEMSATDQAPHI